MAIWLYHRRLAHLIIILLVYVIGVLGHDFFTVPFDWFRDHTSMRVLSMVMYAVIIILFGGLSISIYRSWLQHKHRHLLRSLGLMTLFFAVLANFTIMPFKAELVHFIQYALIGFLLVPLFKNFLTSIYVGIILGFFDEFYQFAGLSKLYFDYNDVVLNTIGSALGVVSAFAAVPVEKRKFTNLYAWPMWIWTASHLLTGLFFLIGVIKFFKEQGFPYWYRTAIKDYPDMFWQVPSSIAGPWHLITPYEGVLIAIGLPCIYWPLRPYFFSPEWSQTKQNKKK